MARASGPLIGVTIGDAAGVGPELILREWRALRALGPTLVYGSVAVLAAAARSLQAVGLAGQSTFVPVSRAAEARDVAEHVIPVVDVDNGGAGEAVDRASYPWGEPVAAFGLLQHSALIRAIDDALANEIGGIMTAPWHKARLLDAGLPATGHTEVLAERAGCPKVVMVLAGERLRVALATTHIPLSEVSAALTVNRIDDVTRMFLTALRDDWGLTDPTLAVCGVNPHAGEQGVIGDDELRLFPELTERWLRDGVKATGPWPADTLFPRVVAGVQAADGVLAMYHDQGLVPLKTVHFGEAANITIGLPFVRTSVDHGTAYDIAGTLSAHTSSFVYAARLGHEMVARRALASD
jgi:4-hydroxythreonine-4-phosphate dehydrogenase